jgi:hypothetical protein
VSLCGGVLPVPTIGRKIFWDDGSKSSFNASDMMNYCINTTHGTRVTQILSSSSESEDEQETTDPAVSNCDERRRILDDAGLTYYTTKNNDTWTTICTGMSITHSQRKLYYQWLMEFHGYGHKSTSVKPFKFVNPYGQSTKTHKFPPGIPFPYPCGGEWDSMVLPDEGGQVAIMQMVNQIAAEHMTMMRARRYDFPPDERGNTYDDVTEIEVKVSRCRSP